MKSLFGLAAAGILALSLQVGAYTLTTDEITAETAVLIDADTGQVLFDKSMSRHMEPASITKVLTGLLVMEHSAPEELVTVTETAVDIPWSSYIALTPDEQLTVNDAMYALMLPSANDAANALAEHVAGSQAAFAELMNRRALELGAADSSFVNAHGLPDLVHYTSAYDMAVITRAAIKNPDFLRYFGTGRYTMPGTNKQPDERPFTNQQFMLLKDQWPYNPDVIGGKVGYTEEAGNTMSTAAAKNGRTLVAVVMKCGIDEKYDDTQLLLDFGFDEFTSHTVPAELFGEQTAQITQDGNVVGSATFSHADDVPLLLHNSISPESLAVRFEVPASLEKDTDYTATAYVETTAATGSGLPSVLAAVPLAAEMTMLEPVSAAVDPGEPVEKSRWNPAFLFLLIPLALIVAFIIISRVSLSRKRARTRRRRQAAYNRRMERDNG